MQVRLNVSHKLGGDNNTKFYYVDIGSEGHGRPSFRLWISSRLVKKEKIDEKEVEYVEFPARARILKTEKGTLVLKPDSDHIVHYIFVRCGFRGGAKIEIEKPANAEVFCFSEFESPKGSLGVSVGALVVVPKDEKLVYRWRKSGRLYGRPSEGRTLVAEDGSEIELSEVEDELREMLKGEGE